MTRYRSIPIIIDAFQVQQRTIIAPSENRNQGLYVIYPGDYLCIDEKGRAFPCKAEDFERYYEPIDESNPPGSSEVDEIPDTMKGVWHDGYLPDLRTAQPGPGVPPKTLPYLRRRDTAQPHGSAPLDYDPPTGTPTDARTSP